MIRVTIKKQNLPDWISLTKTRVFKHKFLGYYIYKIYYQLLGYEVEVLENDVL